MFLGHAHVPQCSQVRMRHHGENLVEPRLDPNDAVAPWVCMVAKGDVPPLGLMPDLTVIVAITEKHVIRCGPLLGWCATTMMLASFLH